MAEDYNRAWDALTKTIGSAKGQNHGSVDDLDHLTIDQRLKVIEVAALLSIAQELSDFNPNNTIGYRNGAKVNGWGHVIP